MNDSLKRRAGLNSVLENRYDVGSLESRGDVPFLPQKLLLKPFLLIF